jgi:hypothetical protein
MSSKASYSEERPQLVQWYRMETKTNGETVMTRLEDITKRMLGGKRSKVVRISPSSKAMVSGA